MGILFCWQIGAASSERPEATSPSTATTLSREISFRTIVADSPGFGLVVLGNQFDLLAQHAAGGVDLIDRPASVPLCDDCPNAASLPVNEANSPTLITLPSAADWSADFLQPVAMRTTPSISTGRKQNHFFIVISCLKSLTAKAEHPAGRLN